jgi:hypothetical protein
MVEFFKPEGGNAEVQFKLQLERWYFLAYCNLGAVYFNLDLKMSKEYFEKSLDFTDRLTDKLLVLGFIGRIKVLESFEFEFEVKGKRWDFEKIWNICLENKWEMDNEKLVCCCVEYLVSSILKDGKIDKDVLGYLELNRTAKALFYGLSFVLGVKIKGLDEVIKTLRDLDLMWFPNVDDVKKQVLIDEAKIEVEEMYNCVLENREEYEAYKRLVWNKTFYSSQAIARTMFFYIIGDLKTAKALAEFKSSYYPKVLSEIFKELAEAIDEEIKAKSDAEKEKAQEKVKRAFVKLFYFVV